VLDRADTVVDVVTFEGGSYPGVPAGPTAATDEVSVREPATADTDASGDFTLHMACAVDADCGPCGLCVALRCEERADGATCDDGDACTTGETCDAAGICGGGAASCDDAGVGEDAGAATDGGTRAPDAGAPPVTDASVIDAGSVRDGGVGSRDGGGCAVASGEHGASLLLVALVLGWRRRRCLS